MSVFQKLNGVQTELKAPKNQYNSFGKYKYRSLEDIQEGLKPLLKKHKCIITLSDTITAVNDRVYVTAKATFACMETGETIFVEASAREPLTRKGMDDSQVTVSTSSYARKTAMNGLLAIDDNRDPDVTTDSEEPNRNKETLNGYLKEKGIKAAEFCQHFLISNQKKAQELLGDKGALEGMIEEYKQVKSR